MAKISSTEQSILDHIKHLLVPKEILLSFEIEEIIENDTELLIRVIEQIDCVPKTLQGKDCVLDGFMRSVTIQDFPQNGKQHFIHINRRRWKEKGSVDGKGYHNQYEFTSSGTMATKSFGAFLKRNSLIATQSHIAQSLGY